MTGAQTTYAAMIALGATCVAIAGGFVYADFRAREGAWVDLQFRVTEPSATEREALLDAWRDDRLSLYAFGVGAPGLGLGVFGLIGLVLSRRPSQAAEQGTGAAAARQAEGRPDERA